MGQATPKAANALQQRITALDRSKDRFSLQLAEAYNLLDLDLETISIYYSHVDAEKVARRGFDPKEEWVLRWLLKRFGEEVVGKGSPCLEEKAWVLFRIVTTRLPATVIARLLSTQNFNTILEKTFQGLYMDTQTPVPSKSVSSTALSPQRPLSRESSSSTTVQEGLSTKKSKKRKRDQTRPSTDEIDTPKFSDTHKLHFAICSAVKQLETCNIGTSQGSDGFAAEHMKAALKASVKQCSRILGGFFGSLSNVLGTVDHRSQDRKLDEAANIYENLIQPMVELWNLRSSSSDDNAGLLSARAFSTDCLLPAIRLLAVSQNQHANVTDGVRMSQTIEALLRAHVILPARNAFVHGKRMVEGNEGISTIATQELLTPLAEAVSEELKASPAQSKSHSLGAIPILFSVALKHVELDTPKRRITETPWLQALFVQLANCAISNFPVSQPICLDDRCIDVLENMLRLAVEHKLVLDLSILQSIVLFLSGVSGIGLSPRVKWTLIGLCLEIDPNLAITLPVKNKGSESNSAVQANVLGSVLTKITTLGFRECDDVSRDYGVMLHNVILPLLRGFIRARNLPGLIDVWKQQIVAWEQLKAFPAGSDIRSKYTMSIWEDEVLSRAVSEKLEPGLTRGQMLHTLQQFSARMVTSGDVMSSNAVETCAEITILDCFVYGVKVETTPPAIKKQLDFVLGSLLATKEDDSVEPYSWRVWRTLATAARHWPPGGYNSSSSTTLLEVCARAQQQLLRIAINGANSPQTPATYAKALFAFRFLIASAEASGLTGYDASLHLAPSIQGIISSMKIYADGVCQDIDNGITGSKLCVTWDGQPNTIKTQYTLTLACAAQLALAPQTLSCFQPALLHSFIEELFRCAVLQASLKQTKWHPSAEGRQVTYRLVWEELLQAGAVQEYMPLADTVRKNLVLNFLSSGMEEESNVSIRIAREELALSGLYEVSFDALKVHERNQIFQHALSRMLSSGPAAHFTNYSALLVLCMPHIKKSTDLFSNPLYLWKIADALDLGLREPTPDALFAFRKFVSKTVKLAEKRCIDLQAVEFLEAFLGTLHQHLTSPPQSVKYFDLILASVSLGELRRSWNKLPPPLREEKYSLFKALCNSNFDRLLTFLEASDLGSGDVAWKWGPLLEFLAASSDLLEGRSHGVAASSDPEGQERRLTTIGNLLDTIRGISGTGNLELSLKERASWTMYDNLVITEKMYSSSMDKGLQGSAGWMLEQLESTERFRTPRAKQSWQHYIVDTHHKLDPGGQADVFAGLAQSMQDKIPEDNELRYLRKILDNSYGPEAKSPAMKSSLAQLFSVLSEVLTHLSGPESCIIGMHCLNLLMRKNSWAISQWHVDSLLSTISSMTSKSGPQTDSGSSDIFICLTRLFGTLLAGHRSKLGGRYHLVVLALQGMLRCLFTSYASVTDKNKQLPRPPWLKDTKLEGEHATAYARLLTSICDPTVSAVTRSKTRARQELNDETKKARSIAGQYLQYLIMEFCQCQLQGRMDPEVRRGLNPGLYAIFDAMSQDLMRTLDSALDAPGRAIFKMVYDDYRRFGRWNGA